jgi:hypothetical protein
MFMRFRGGGVGHQITRDWDEFLRNDGTVVEVDKDEDLQFDEAVEDDENDGSEGEGASEDKDEDDGLEDEDEDDSLEDEED